jgi:hypothetical protein
LKKERSIPTRYIQDKKSIRNRDGVREIYRERDTRKSQLERSIIKNKKSENRKAAGKITEKN